MMAFGSSLTPGQTSALRYRVPGTDLDPAEARATGLATGIGGSPTRPVQPAYQQPSSTTGSGRGRRAESVVDKFRKSCSRSVLRSRAPVWFASRVLASGNHVCESVMSWSCARQCVLPTQALLENECWDCRQFTARLRWPEDGRRRQTDTERIPKAPVGHRS
jgi:hypothetical protein